jgi:hypothetical protein
MSQDPTPIDPDEPILRRIHISQYKAGLPIPIQAGAFRPSTEDDDGLSFYREYHLSAVALARSGRKPAEEYVVVRYRARDLLGLGLTLEPTCNPDDLPGHVIIPELSKSKYHDNKAKCKEIHLRLATLGSKDLLTGFVSPPS